MFGTYFYNESMRRMTIGFGQIFNNIQIKRKDSNGNFIWPGFGENMRVLKWIVDRVKGKVSAKSNSFGLVPYFDDIIWSGLEFDSEKFSSLIEVPKNEGLKEIDEVKEHFDRFGEFMPNELESQRIELEQRLHKEG